MGLDSWFSHLAVEVSEEEVSAEWLEPVSDEDYGKLMEMAAEKGVDFDDT